jgi:hypothetical protein
MGGYGEEIFVMKQRYKKSAVLKCSLFLLGKKVKY